MTASHRPPGYPDIRAFLTPRQHAAALEVVRRVRLEIHADLWRVLLFGSRARRQARPDSDVDLLLVFRHLPPDREPQAGEAEAIADEVAASSGVPVTVWSVSFPDLERGRRTPMLVDSLDDGVPLWPAGSAPLHLPFTPDDAVWCTARLLERVEEGGEEVQGLLHARDVEGAARRVRDDLVRLCTGLLLLHGETRPRRGDAARRISTADPVLRWAAESFWPPGHEEDAPVPPPPGGFGAAFAAVERLRDGLLEGREALVRRARSLRDHPVYNRRTMPQADAPAPPTPRVQP
ncbi:MAG: nucleotidyltransferase domain-containing protein [Gemmatimonadetes bacterium]|nr:nucleotidyltransferase domain-containing protein [Gemmatimonadota bacterium]